MNTQYVISLLPIENEQISDWLKLAGDDSYLRYDLGAIEAMRKDPNRTLTGIASSEGEMVGFIDSERIDGDIEFISIFVRPSHRKRGIAKAALRLYSKNQHAAITFADVDRGNIASIRTFSSVARVDQVTDEGMVRFRL